MVTVFGIRNCDTVKKALRWLEATGVEHRFHDFRKDGLSEALVDTFLAGESVERLINTRGTTWRKLPEGEREPLDLPRARALMLHHDAIIKRPVWMFSNGEIMTGFSKKDQAVIAARLGVPFP